MILLRPILSTPLLVFMLVLFVAGCGPDERAGEASKASEPPIDIAIVGISVISMDSPNVDANQTVLLSGSKIETVGATDELAVPDGVVVVDGTGKYLMPGLADMHAHVGFDFQPGQTTQPVELLLYLATGVTAIRNAVGTASMQAMEQAVEDGDVLGPRQETASPLLEGEDAVWDWATKVLSEEQARDTVRQFAADGYRTIKIYHTLSREAYEAVVDEAAQHNISVFGHVPFVIGVKEVLANGQSSIEHFRGYDIDGLSLEVLAIDGGRSPERFGSWLNMSNERMDELAAATVAAGTYNCPTFVVNDMLANAETLHQLSEHPMAEYMPGNLMARFESSGLEEIFSPESRQMLARVRPQMLKFLKTLSAAGAPLMTGTDTFPSLIPGYTLIDEIQAFVDAGLTPYEALQASTTVPAEYLGVADERGKVLPGMTADLILLNANPLDDVENLWQLDGVIANGVWLPQEKLLADIKELIAVNP